MIGLDGDAFGLRLKLPLEAPQAALQLILERVGHGDELHVPLGRKRLIRRAASSSAATDKADANPIAAGRVRTRRQGQAAQQTGADGGNGRRLHEVTARGAFIQIRSHVSPSRGGVRTEAKISAASTKRRGRRSSLQPYSFSKSFGKGSRFSRSRSAWSAAQSGPH